MKNLARKKILVIKNGLGLGGTTSSFYPFIDAISKYDDLEVNVWINKYDKKYDGNFPSSVKIVDNIDLEQAFSEPSGYFKKLFNYVKRGSIWARIKEYFICKNNPNSLKRIVLGQSVAVKRAKSIKKIDLSFYDAVVTWEEMFPLYFLAETVVCPKKIAFIHPNYKQAQFDKKIDEKSFEKLDAVVAVSDNCRQDLVDVFPKFKDKFFGARNCLPLEKILIKAKDEPVGMRDFGGVKLITVCRLQSISKALDRAVRIAYRLKSKGLNFHWYFVGDGEDRALMESMIDEYGLKDYVTLFGAKENPYPYVINSDLFVLQSYYEGLPVVVDEALALGMPVLVSNYNSASEQVSADYGVIANNDEDDIFDKLKDLISNADKIKILKENLKSLDRTQFTNGERYKQILDKVIL